MRRNRFYLNDAEELSEMTADDPEAASSIDAPEENDVDAESGGADYPSVGSPLPGTLPEQGSSETDDVQVEDFFDKKRSKKRRRGCGDMLDDLEDRKRSKKRRRGMFDYYDDDDEGDDEECEIGRAHV